MHGRHIFDADPDKIWEGRLLDQEACESVFRLYVPHLGASEHLDGFSSRDMRKLGSILRYHDPVTWERIQRNDLNGVSILIHEVAEHRWLKEQGHSLFKPAGGLYRPAHTHALLAESEFLLRLSQGMGYHVSRGSLIRWNPNSSARPDDHRGARQDLRWVQKVDESIQVRDEDRQAVLEFFARIGAQS